MQRDTGIKVSHCMMLLYSLIAVLWLGKLPTIWERSSGSTSTDGIKHINSIHYQSLLSLKNCNLVILSSIAESIIIQNLDLSDIISFMLKFTLEDLQVSNLSGLVGSVELFSISIHSNLNQKPITVLNFIIDQLTLGLKVSAGLGARLMNGGTGRYSGCLTKSLFSVLKKFTMKMTWMRHWLMMKIRLMERNQKLLRNLQKINKRRLN
jgi:hypothetical protein